MSERMTGSSQSASQAQLDSYAREYGSALRKYFVKRGAQPATAEDLAQEVFARLIARESDEAIDNPRGYLMQTAFSVWSEHWRKRRVRPDHAHENYADETHSPEGIAPDRVLEGKEAVAAFRRALEALPERTRDVYLLCHVDGMKRKDLAARLGISVSAVDKHLMAAKRALGRVFGDDR